MPCESEREQEAIERAETLLLLAQNEPIQTAASFDRRVAPQALSSPHCDLGVEDASSRAHASAVVGIMPSRDAARLRVAPRRSLDECWARYLGPR